MSEHELLDIMRVATGADPDVGAFLAQAEQGRCAGPQHFAGVLAERGALRPGLTAQQGADIMYAVTTYDVYRALIHDRGWLPDAAEAWVAETLAALLLP